MGKWHGKTSLKTPETKQGGYMKTNKVAVQVNKGKNLSNRGAFGFQWILVLILIFFFAFLPLLSSMARYRGDEHYYTDAAIRMVQTGGLLYPL